MAALSWDRIVERGKQHNKTVICEVEKRGKRRYFRVKCDICEEETNKFLENLTVCRKCFYKRLSFNNKDFILKAIIVHPEKYDYNLVEYINNQTKIKIICKTCNYIFEQIPNSHLKGRGCPKCAKNYKYNNQDFTVKANLIHPGKYDYSLISYVNSQTKIKIKCNTCNNIFLQSPAEHLSGKGCRKCFLTRLSSNNNDFILKAIIVHPNKYDYNLVEYINGATKIKIICKTCNYIFEQTPHIHLRGSGCPKCKESKGEIKVAKYLSEKNIKFIPQKTFPTLRNINLLKCDFYLEDLNLLIEYDGEYHYKPVRGYTLEKKQKNLENNQRRDKIKNEWAKANNIPLLRIPYWDFDRIEELIEAFIIQHTKKKEIKQLVLEM